MTNKLKWIFLNKKSENSVFSLKLRIPSCFMMFLFISVSSSSLFAAGSAENYSNDSNSTVLMQQTISGVVTDNTGIPLPGVSVFIKGTTKGTFTDFDGKYTLNVDAGQVVEFSYIGFKSQLVTVGDSSTYNISLKEDAAQLDEVVVVGYGSQKKSSVTGSVSTIQAKELVEVPVTNTTQLLTGRTPGVLTRQISSEPGSDATAIQIRGFGTALVLVDGVQQDMATVDPNDIESISVLKDAAAAIYGIAAGNGVILITTKRGKEGKVDISFHNNISFQNPTRFQTRVGALDYLKMGVTYDGLGGIDGEKQLELYESGEKTTDTDWYRAVFTEWTPLIQNNLSARGGSKDLKYFASIGKSNQESVYRSGDLNFVRHNGRINVDAKVNDKLSATFDMSYRLGERKAPLTNPSQMFNALQNVPPIDLGILPNPDRTSTGPYAETRRDKGGFRDGLQERTNASIELKYDLGDITPGLSARARFDYYSTLNKSKTVARAFDRYRYAPNEEDPNDPIYNGDYPYIPLGPSNSLGSVFESVSNGSRERSYFRLDYKNSFEGHNFSALALTEYINTKSAFLSASGRDLLSSAVPFLTAVDPSTITASNGESASKIQSYVGRFNYNYKKKYLLEASVRVDKSWRFKPGARTGYFPGVSAGWVLSKEKFISNVNAINFLKLRASYSETGNDAIGNNYAYLTAFNILDPTSRAGINLVDGVTGVINDSRLPNENTSWLTYKLANIGLDGRLWKGLLAFEFDVFYRLEDGVFGTANDLYPASIGAALPLLNITKREDRGFEVLLKHNNRINKNFKYNISANFTFAQKNIVENAEVLSEDPEIAAIQQREGFRNNRFFGFKSDGLFNSQEEIDIHADQDAAGNSTLKPGDIKYIDQNGDGFVDIKDNVEIGYGVNPDISFGLNLGLTYKNLSLSALFQGAARFSTYFTGAAAGPFANNTIPYDYHLKYSWTPSADDPNVNINPDAQLPYITSGGEGLNANSERVSDFWLRPNDYIRLKNLNINYTFDKELVESIGLRSLDLYIAASNLFTWDKLGIYSDTFDPETRSGNATGGPVTASSGVNTQNGRSYPIQKIVTLGVKVSL